MNLKKGNSVLSVLCLLGGLLIIYLAKVQKLAFTAKGLPGPAFFPIICGCGIVICGAGIFLENLRARKKEHPDPALEESLRNDKEIRNLAYIFGTSIAVLVLTNVLGLILSIGLGVIFLVRFYARETWHKAIAVGIVLTVVLYLIFGLFLEVPLPKGPFGF